jgi:hypothetical protein
MKNVNDFLLTKGVTVGMARQWMTKKDSVTKGKLVDLIYHRFYNRYIIHIQATDGGFLKMAVSCLLIETLESFKQGIPDTKGKSGQMFRDFFSSQEELFPGFKEIHSAFFTSIRCGILHQAETTNGWRILHSGQLLDVVGKSINAKKFTEAVNKALDKYITNLRASEFDNPIWRKAILKIEDVCENCNP